MEHNNGDMDQSDSSQSILSTSTIPYEMDSSDKNINHKVLKDEYTISEEWSVTTSALNSSNTMSSNSSNNIGTLKEYCANPSDTLKDKEDFMVLESTSTSVNISNFNADDTKCSSMRKSSAFKKKHETHTHNISHMFENILQDDSQMHSTNPSDNVKDKENSLVLESTSTGINISSDLNVDDIKYLSMRKSSAFQKKHETPTHNVSHLFENLLQDDSQMHSTNPSDTVKDKENSMVLEFTSTGVNISDLNADDTKCLSMHRRSVFQKSNKAYTYNVSHMFENILQDDSEMEISQDSIRLSHFQNRKRTLPPNDEDFDEIIKSDDSEMDSAKVSAKTPKLQFSNKNKDQSYYDVPDYNLSTTDNISITGDVNDSKIKKNVFKKPSQLVNDCSTNIMNESKTEILTNKFTKKSTAVDGSVFDNIINDLSTTSDSVSNDKTTSLNSTYAVSNTNRMSLCGTIEMPSLNHTYDIPVNSTYSETGLFSESGKNNIELKNSSIGQPMNETYTLENDQTSNKSTFDMSRNSENAKNTLSDTYTIENNFNDTQPKSVNKIINTLADMSNIYDQSKSLQKPNFIRKLPLNIGSQDYNITINGSNNSSVNDEMDKTENNKSTKFKLRKNYYEGDSEIFNNIITSSQENEVPTSENTNNDVIVNTTNISIGTSNNDLFNISSKSKSKEDMDNSMNKLLTQQSSVLQDEVLKNDKNISNIPFSHTFSISKQNIEESVNTTSTQLSNVLRDGIFENYKIISEIPLADKFNISSSFKRSYKFNFNKNFGRLSLSNQEHSMNLDTNEEKTNILNKSVNYLNFDFGCNSQISKIQEENHTDSQITQQLSVSSPSVLNALSHGVEKSSHDLASTQNTTFTLSQSPGLHFTGNHNVNAHSVVFSDLIEHSVNIDTSVNISKLMKFKNHKNVSESNSIIFENLITNSQESNTTSTQNATLSHSVLYDQSKVQSDEISIFANMNEILSDNESLTNSDHLKKRDTDGTLSLEKSNCSEVDLKVLNNTSNNSNSAYSETKSINGNDTNVSTSEISVNGNKTCSEQTISLESEESLNNHSLSNITAGLLENNSSPSICHLTSSTSKCVLASFNTDKHVSNKTGNQTNTCVSYDDTKNHFINTPEHSLHSIYNNEILTINERDVSKRNQLKRSISSKCSTSSTSQNESITLNTIGSLDSNRSPTNPSKISRCSKLVDNIESLDASMRSVNESIKSTSNYSLTVNTRDSSSISSNLSMQENDTNNSSRISTRSSKEKSCLSDIVEPEISDYTDKLLNNDELTLNNTAGSLEQKEVSTKKSVSKSLTMNTRDLSSISSNSSMQEDETNNVSRIFTRSSKKKSCSSDIVEPEISNYTDKLLKNDELTLNNTAGSLEQKEVSTKKSVSKSLTMNTRDLSSISSNSSMQEDETNNVSRISTRSSKEKSCSSDIVEPEISNYNTDGLQDKNNFTSSRVTRLSSSLKKTLKNNEVMLLKVNANRISTRSSRSSKSSSDSNNESDNIQSDDSIFWTTLSDDSRSKSTTQNFCANEFQTPTNNRLALAEHIVNKIGIMSVNRQKATHPGAFELEDNISGPLTRSSVRHANGSPSILTKLLAGGNNTSESMTSSQSFTETIVDQSQVEDKVKVKFTSLYKKEPWITNRLYNFLVGKLTPKYNIYSIKYAEKFVKYLASILQNVHTAKVDRQLYSDMLRYHMARYGIINDTFDYLGFLTNYIPKPYYDELIPGWQLATSEVKFDPNKYFVAIMKDEEFLNKVLEYLDAT